MINSAQSVEGARYVPEKKGSINYETIHSKVEHTPIARVNKKFDATEILKPINQTPDGVNTTIATTDIPAANPVSVQKLVLEVRGIFAKFVSELSQFTVPTKNAQEIT